MYTVTKLYLRKVNSLKVYNTDDYTPAEFQALLNVNTTLYLAVLDSKGTYRAIDYSHLITDLSLSDTLTTWTAVADILTEELVLGYETTLPGFTVGSEYPENPVTNWDVMNTLNTFNVNYANCNTGEAGVFALRWNMPDLQVSLQGTPDKYPDLSHSVLVSNGFICRPVYDSQNNILYGRDGAKYCWQSGTHQTPEIQLLDFSALGDIEVRNIVFNATPKDGRNVALNMAWDKNTINFSSDWVFTFTDYSLYEYSPIIVICGTPILPDQYRIIDEHTLKINPVEFTWATATVKRKYQIAKPLTTAETAYSEKAFWVLLKEDLTEETSTQNFVIMVKTPNIYVIRHNLTTWNSGLTLDLYTPEGILIKRNTGTIANYHCDSLSDRKELTLQNHELVYINDRPLTSGQQLFVAPDCKHIPCRAENVSDYSMVYLSK